MHMQTIISLVHRMGRVTKPEILKALPLMEVKVLERPPNTNITPKISDAKKVIEGYLCNQLCATSFLTPVRAKHPDVTNYTMGFTTTLSEIYVYFNILGEVYSQKSYSKALFPILVCVL
jgi:hypothetical protein